MINSVFESLIQVSQQHLLLLLAKFVLKLFSMEIKKKKIIDCKSNYNYKSLGLLLAKIHTGSTFSGRKFCLCYIVFRIKHVTFVTVEKICKTA